MLVMKFGGASLRNPEAIRQAGRILNRYKSETLLIVVSAMGKTTNALERLSRHAQNREEDSAWSVYKEIEDFHLRMCRELFPETNHPVFQEMEDGFRQISRLLQAILLLEDFPDRTYDRIVSYGELLSSHIVHRYLEQQGVQVEWMDARQLIRTDSDYRQAEVNWGQTERNIQDRVKPVLNSGKWVLTQGFIGSNAQGRTTTLGREGSDFSAAIFAASLNADSQIVWKDVPGIMNTDPALDANAVILPELSYSQLVTMSWFGASVIHPKTIRPLRNAHIPLIVKSFINPEAPGTRVGIHSGPLPVATWSRKTGMSLVRLEVSDFSFFDASHTALLFRLLDREGIQPLLSQVQGIRAELVLERGHAVRLEALCGTEEKFSCEALHNLELMSALLPDGGTLPPRPVENQILASFQTRESLHWLIQPEG